jgi:ABC-2 type transport system ATP-binding protein
MNHETANILDIRNLSRYFGSRAALHDVTMQIPRGKVFGVIGENGAGKTTLIKHILGLLKAKQGSVSVFGMDPVQQPRQVLSRIGYLSEQPDYPEWMTVTQFTTYMAAFYKTWDHRYATELLDMMNVDPAKRIGELSKGQQARVGLCAAQAHRPELLLLDEPSSGLDPVARNEILSAVIRTVSNEGRSVLLSSHLLDEVERVADHLVFFSQGSVVLSEPMEAVLSKHHQLSVRFAGQLGWQKVPGVFSATESGGEWQVFAYGEVEACIHGLRNLGAEILEQRRLSLNEAFIARSQSRLPLREAA